MYTGDYSLTETLQQFFDHSVLMFNKEHGEHYALYLKEIQALAKTSLTYRELGVMQGVSMASYLLAQPDTTYAHGIDISLDRLQAHKRLFDSYPVEFQQISSIDSRLSDLPPVDMLLIDSAHKAGHVRRELEIHSDNVNKYIVCHDTTAIRPIRAVIEEFAKLSKLWQITKRVEVGVGYTVLSRK